MYNAQPHSLQGRQQQRGPYNPLRFRPEDKGLIELHLLQHEQDLRQKLYSFPLIKFIHKWMLISYLNQPERPHIERCLFCKVPTFECNHCHKIHKRGDFIRHGTRAQTYFKICEECRPATSTLVKCNKSGQSRIGLLDGKFLPSLELYLDKEYNYVPPLRTENGTGTLVKMSDQQRQKKMQLLPAKCRVFACDHLIETINKNMSREHTIATLARQSAQAHGHLCQKPNRHLVMIAYYYSIAKQLNYEFMVHSKTV